MSYEGSAKKPLADDEAPVGAAASLEEANRPSSGTVHSMGIEAAPRQPPACCQEEAARDRRPSNWSGSFGGPSERVSNERDLMGYFRSLYQEPTMDKWSDFAVTLSTIPFLFIQIPQIIKNFSNPGGIPAAWTGVVSGGMGNLLLCTFFTDGGEMAQARVQAIGAITNIFVVAQARLLPAVPIVPLVPFLAVMVIMVAGLVIPLLKALGKGEKVFAAWLKCTTIIGMTVLFFSLTYSIMDDGPAMLDDSDTVRTCAPQTKEQQEAQEAGGTKKEAVGLLIPGLVSLAGFVISSLMVFFDYTTSSTGGILATMLFMYMPVPQNIKNLINPADAAGFDLGFVYFGTLGNGLGLARALYTRNYVWLTGSSWGCFIGGVLMSITCVIANRNCDEGFMDGTGVACLGAFNVIFIVYSAALFYFTLANDIRPPSPREVRLP